MAFGIGDPLSSFTECNQPVMGQDPNNASKQVVVDHVATLKCLPHVFHNIVQGLLVFAGATMLILFLYAGFKYVNSSGDPKRVDEAKNVFKYAMIGFIIIFLSFLIINILAFVTGAKCLNSFGFTQCG